MREFYTKDDFLEEVSIDDSLDTVPSSDTRNETVSNVRERNIGVTVYGSREEAREYLLSLVPSGTSVMTGHSTTLNEIGLPEALEQADDVEYLAPRIRAIDDDEARQDARRKAVTADVFFDSPNAIATTGEIVGVNGKGTSLGAWPFAAKQLILVSGTNKIVPTIDDAIERIRTVAYPLEDARVRAAANHGSVIGKTMIYEYEKRDDRTELVLLDGKYGF